MWSILVGLFLAFSVAIGGASANEQRTPLITGQGFIISQGSDYFHYEGKMAPVGMYLLFQQLRNNEEINAVAFNSKGGRADTYYAANVLAHAMPNLKMGVKDGDICVSACAYVLTLFDNMYIERGAMLAFHTPYFEGMKISETLQDYTRRTNVEISKFTETWINSGWNYSLFSLIIYVSSPDTYLVFEDMETLIHWKDGTLTTKPTNEAAYNFSVLDSEEFNLRRQELLQEDEG